MFYYLFMMHIYNTCIIFDMAPLPGIKL